VSDFFIQQENNNSVIQKADDSITIKILAKKKTLLLREKHIVDAALVLLLERGIDKVTVSSIANRVGIGKGTIYKHFLTKNEIYMRIALDYECELAKRLREGIADNTLETPDAAARTYFQSRLSHPALDRLVQQLERRLEKQSDVNETMAELIEVRASNVAALNEMVKELIAAGILEDVRPSFHYLACWAFAQGAVELYFNPCIQNMSENEKQQLLEFIINIGVNMGNRGHLPE
jgi:TetR/AcrR family transcriptional regulator